MALNMSVRTRAAYFSYLSQGALIARHPVDVAYLGQHYFSASGNMLFTDDTNLNF